MLCPTDSTFNRKHFNGSKANATTTLGDDWARGNYAANAALGEMRVDTGPSGTYAAMRYSTGWKLTNTRGVMGANTSVKAADIIDGLSNTCLLGEVRAGVVDCDSRGVWAMPYAGASALWAHGGIRGLDAGPNCPNDLSDDVLGCNSVRSAFGSNAALLKEKMPCYDAVSNTQATMRSLHPNGVNSCFCDGSVHWLSDYIQVSPSNGTVSNSLSVWDRLMCSADGQIVNSNAY
jgi:prepilin-type processing-associated H-X9-DG protein